MHRSVSQTISGTQNVKNLRCLTEALCPRITDMAEDESPIDRAKLEAFLDAATNFFNWNSGRNAPNILLKLVESIDSLQKTVAEAAESSERASTSSEKLARALNWLTAAAVVLGIFNAVAILFHGH
jgi:hypothetical protein